MYKQEQIPFYLACIFIFTVLVLIGCILYGYNVVLKKKNSRFRKGKVILLGSIITAWLAWISYLSTLHILDQFSELPPRMGLVLFPPLLAVIMLANSRSTDRLLDLIPKHWLLFIQSFRIITGILFYLLFLHHIIPVQMTFLGKNFDLLFGLTAPVTGYLYLKKKIPAWILPLWHLAGIAFLFIVVVTAVLSAPFPFKVFREEELNTIIAYFPFVFMPGFVIPLGLLFHLFSLKQSLKKLVAESKKLNDRLLSYFGIPVVALLMAIIMHFQFHSFSADFFFVSILSFGFTLLLWYGNRLIITKMRMIYPDYDQTMKRMFVQFMFNALFSVFTIFIIDCFLYIYVFHRIPTVRDVLLDVSIGIIISGIMLIIYESIYFFSSWKLNILEVEQLKSIQVQRKLDILKNQINPHFLFNSLNSLTSLIEDDVKGAVEYVQKMSDVYRYILQSNESELNCLTEEKKFIIKYFYLLKIRFPDSLFYEINIPDSMSEMQIPQLTLLMLVDNAIKHNVISPSRPLHIKIDAVSDGSLTVINNLQKKQQLLKTGNFGLRALQRRYKAIGDYELHVMATPAEFRVTLPLLLPAKQTIQA